MGLFASGGGSRIQQLQIRVIHTTLISLASGRRGKWKREKYVDLVGGEQGIPPGKDLEELKERRDLKTNKNLGKEEARTLQQNR